jgi:hypothetical protein
LVGAAGAEGGMLLGIGPSSPGSHSASFRPSLGFTQLAGGLG